ncbi:MAG: HEAT repeat domain-containing protein [Pseudomonadota bacterium]
MTKKVFPDLSNDETGEQHSLWSTLGQLEREQPSDRLRQQFYARLHDESKPRLITRLGNWLGLASGTGWVTATACLLAGVVSGLVWTGDSGSDRLAVLEQNVSQLNRSLILDRLENQQPGKRLMGVLGAAESGLDDAQVTERLLTVATTDRVDSIRSAAVEALGRRLASAEVAAPLMQQLENADAPLVQFALVDLVLRHGTPAQIDALRQLAEQKRLFPDLNQHVLNTLKRNSV